MLLCATASLGRRLPEEKVKVIWGKQWTYPWFSPFCQLFLLSCNWTHPSGHSVPELYALQPSWEESRTHAWLIQNEHVLCLLLAFLLKAVTLLGKWVDPSWHLLIIVLLAILLNHDFLKIVSTLPDCPQTHGPQTPKCWYCGCVPPHSAQYSCPGCRVRVIACLCIRTQGWQLHQKTMQQWVP